MAKLTKEQKGIIGFASAIAAFFGIKKLVAAPAKTASFNGSIIDAITGMPIVGETVYIDDYSSIKPSDVSGYFVVNVPPGTYYTLSVEGYEPISI